MKNLQHVPDVLPSSIPLPESVVTATSYIWYFLHQGCVRIPGMRYVMDYIAKSHQADPYRTMVEIGLIIYGLVYYLSKPWKQGQEVQARLNARDVDQLIEEWEPEPIVISEQRDAWRLQALPVVSVIDEHNCCTVTRNGGQERYDNVLNMASTDYLQLSRDPTVVEIVKNTISNYGVGSCGPAGFYGNQDVHYNLEYELARFFGTENAVLYGQDFCVAASVVPAFTKRGDVIVADDRISLAMQNALQLSRSTVYYFKHNDMAALEELLAELDQRERAEQLPSIPRKFIITEGLFHNTGDIAPLPELVALKHSYRYRLIVDESHSLGVLGRTGRGLTEHFHMDRNTAVDITIGSMATALGSSGGFALGDNVMSHHQRIGSNAYCFSASLPPYCCAAAHRVLSIMEADSSAVTALHKVTSVVYNAITKDEKLSQYMIVTSSPHSSVIHLQLTPEIRRSLFNSSVDELFEELSRLHSRHASNKYVAAWEEEERLLQRIVDIALKKHILFSRNTLVHEHETLPVAPGLKISCHALLKTEQAENACEVLSNAVVEAITAYGNSS
ncbi:HFR103Cp [Eremothecium sinecaudum]|uniref:serine C-palmitoyltransferase n=1 Tax=Eremothecium sinecaudum TaxID=45286 RepID=A0A109UZS8_9SACH|nr:HFR103Cp [Eremothecium sinecaudum]AMD21958.1 HFR103Cp [Eremothecium sinecaudum]